MYWIKNIIEMTAHGHHYWYFVMRIHWWRPLTKYSKAETMSIQSRHNAVVFGWPGDLLQCLSFNTQTILVQRNIYWQKVTALIKDLKNLDRNIRYCMYVCNSLVLPIAGKDCVTRHSLKETDHPGRDWVKRVKQSKWQDFIFRGPFY